MYVAYVVVCHILFKGKLRKGWVKTKAIQCTYFSVKVDVIVDDNLPLVNCLTAPTKLSTYACNCKKYENVGYNSLL